MSVLTVLRALRTLEESVAISDPIAIPRPVVYLVEPRVTAKAAQQQAIITNVPIESEEARMGNYREDTHTVRVRGTFYDANWDRACEIAVAYFDATWAALDSQRPSDQRLSGTVDYLTLHAERDLLQSFDGRPGWEIFVTFTLFETVVPV